VQERRPQSRPLLELSRLDDDRAIRRRTGEQSLERRHEIARLRVDPDRAISPEHRDRVGFVGEHLSPEIAVVICGVISLGCAGLLALRLPMIAGAQAEISPEPQPVTD